MYLLTRRTVGAIATSFALLLGSAAQAAILDISVITWAGDVIAGPDIFVAGPPPKMTTDEFAQAGTPSGNGVSWWDIEIQVTRSTDVATNETIELEMDVFNQTGIHWDDFHITLGFGTGATFVESDEFDGLFFTDDPTPSAVFGTFPNPPMADEAVAPDNLWWEGLPGIDSPGNEIFEVGVLLPADRFEDSIAVFTVRKHATVPEPGGLVLVSFVLAGLCGRRQARHAQGRPRHARAGRR